MVNRKNTVRKFTALLLISAIATPFLQSAFTHSYAQSFGENPDSFPIPSSLPEGTTLSVDGSTSMRVTNEALESRFEEQFPNVDVALDASRTDEAIADLLAGEIDLVATGRPLTEEEKAEGLVEVPLEREKLAIVLGADNAFEGNLTFEQFAQIFRGEITNWSEVGGPDLPIRLVDRPDFSDTRRALSTYEVFRGQPFETGATADPVDVDETEAVINALGNDGIGYAVYSQVENADGIRILPMHQTLPDDPRYPYSQYRAFVYREGAAPAALAFLGFATTAPGQEVIADAEAPVAEAEVEAPAAADTAPVEEEVADPVPEEEAALVPNDGAAAETRGGFPWWLLGIPILGGLLWWLLKGMGGGAPAAAPVAAPIAPVAAPAVEPRMILTPRNCRDAYAYWEIPSDRLEAARRQGGDPLKVRLYDVTGRSKNAELPAHVAEFDCVTNEPDLHLPIQRDDRDYLAEVGYVDRDSRWVPLAKSDSVRVPACVEEDGTGGRGLGLATAGAAAGAAVGAAGLALANRKPALAEPRMILTPRDCRDAYAYWEIPGDRLEAARREGGDSLKVRLYDVTGRVRDAVLPTHVAEFDCANDEPDLHLPIQQDDRDYRAEVGYVNRDNRWVALAKSDAVRVPACVEPDVNLGTAKTPGVDAGRLGLGATAIGTAAAGAAGLGLAGRKPTEEGRMILTPRNSQDAYAYWEVPDSRFAELKKQGGQRKVVRLYDVTNRLPGAALPPATSQFECTGDEPDMHILIKNSDRDYVAEIGYVTADNRWLPAAKSNPVRIPSDLGGNGSEATFPGKAIAATAGAVTAGAAAVGAAAVGTGQRLKDTVAPGKATSRIVLTPRNEKKAYAYWEVPEKAKAAMKSEGGKDLQLRIYDVTDIDVDQQAPHSVLTYDVLDTDRDRFVPLPSADRDYVAEIGYRAEDGSWLELARSMPVRATEVLGQTPGSATAGMPTGIAAGAAGIATGIAAGAAGTATPGTLGAATVPSTSGTATVTPTAGTATATPTADATPATPAISAVTVRHDCAISSANVHAQHNAIQLDEATMRHLQDAVAAKHTLQPGEYVLRIREGSFNYDGDDFHPGEPFVLLWIYGGTVVNQKTRVPVRATWSTLNGYADTLTLNVKEPAQLCAFFIDTFPDDNQGDITLSVIKL